MQGLCWINGTFTHLPQVSAHDRGVLVADGVFETMRVEKGAVADFDAHCARLFEGLKGLKLTIFYSKEQLLQAIEELISKRALGDVLCRLRLTVTRGKPNSSSTIFMSLVPQKLPQKPLELVLTDVMRAAGNPSSRYKTLAYTDNFFAQRLVEVEGKNRIAVMCNQWGRVACGSIGNVFVKVGNEWLTPSVEEGALPGITRGKLLSTGRYNGLPVIEGQVTVEQFLNGELLLTNVLRGIEHGISSIRNR